MTVSRIPSISGMESKLKSRSICRQHTCLGVAAAVPPPLLHRLFSLPLEVTGVKLYPK